MEDPTIAYMGWSGFRIDRPDGSLILVDPPAKVPIPSDRTLYVLITHGHPEHLGGAKGLLARAATAPMKICASPGVCRYLSHRKPKRGVTFIPADEGRHLQLAKDLAVEIFPWRHLPLLPPGGVAPAFAHLLALSSRPVLAARIIRAGVLGPRPDPMLGFRINSNGDTIIAYGEGLHRLCASAEAATRARGSGRETLLAAVEPEDADQLPELICATRPGRVFLYEPHALWRDAFQMPRADLDALGDALSQRGVETTICRAKSPQSLPTQG